MTNSAPTTFDTSRIVTPADIIDDGKIDKTADFGIDEHLALIADIEAEGAVAADLSDAQLDNLAAYFTSLTLEPAMKLWSVVGASNTKNTIGLHTRSGDFLVKMLADPEVPLAEAEKAEQAKEQAKEQANKRRAQAERAEQEKAERSGMTVLATGVLVFLCLCAIFPNFLPLLIICVFFVLPLAYCFMVLPSIWVSFGCYKLILFIGKNVKRM